MNTPEHISKYLKKYLTLAGVEDAVEQGEFDFSNGGMKFVTLAEHDKKYHPEGYEQGDACSKRRGMIKQDPVDTDIEGDEKSGSSGSADRRVPEDKRVQWRRYLRSASDDQLTRAFQQYGDEDKYPELCELLVAERDRRANADMNRWYRDNGERA